jgi:hypothetical protein
MDDPLAKEEATTGVIGANMGTWQNRVKHEKMQILQHAYENPLDIFFLDAEEPDEYGVDEMMVGVAAGGGGPGDGF